MLRKAIAQHRDMWQTVYQFNPVNLTLPILEVILVKRGGWL